MEKRGRIGHSGARPNPVKLGKSLSFSSLCVRGCIDLEKNDECLESVWGVAWALFSPGLSGGRKKQCFPGSPEKKCFPGKHF